MPSRAALIAKAIAYGLLVFLGSALLGFVVAPAIALATGSFQDTEAQATFSFVTLKAVPLLAGLSAAAAVSYDLLARLSIARRVAVYLATTSITWLTGAAIAAFVLG